MGERENMWSKISGNKANNNTQKSAYNLNSPLQETGHVGRLRRKEREGVGKNFPLQTKFEGKMEGTDIDKLRRVIWWEKDAKLAADCQRVACLCLTFIHFYIPEAIHDETRNTTETYLSLQLPSVRSRPHFHAWSMDHESSLRARSTSSSRLPRARCAVEFVSPRNSRILIASGDRFISLMVPHAVSKAQLLLFYG